MSGTLHLPDPVKDTPASARLVYAALEAHDPLTLEEITARTGIARRTATGALRDLRDRDLVSDEVHPDDHRRKLYSTVPSDKSGTHRN